MSSFHLCREATLHANIFLGPMPLGANSTHIGPTDSEFRDYNYGGGMEGILESKTSFGNNLNVFFRGYYYWFHSYHGYAGDNFIGIIRTGITARIINNLHAGAEHYVYFTSDTQRVIHTHIM